MKEPRLIVIDDLPPTLIKRLVIDQASGCWRAANGWHDPDGYAQYNGRYAHRVVWERLIGPIPPGFHVDHVAKRGCKWRDCIWPVHLEPVPVAINNARSNSASAINARKTHCGVCGAEYDLLNTIWTPRGSRKCRACQDAKRTAAGDRDTSHLLLAA